MTMQVVYLDADYRYLHYIYERDTTQPGFKTVPKTGLSPIAYFSLMANPASPISGTQITLAESPAGSGWYQGVLDSAALQSALSGAVGTVVYEVLEVTGDLRVVHDRLVAAVRMGA
jgi:hypothetical protein